MIGNDEKIEMLKKMMAIRKFEDLIKKLYKYGEVLGAIHCYTGEEAVAVGVCSAIKKRDYIFSTHRGHGHAIAKDCDLKRIFAELMGRCTGLSRGMGGSMHLFDIENGLMGGNGIVGGGLPLSLGTAYSAKYKKSDRVTVCFFSEGASNQGTFHEAMNMASLWKLPLLFVCENNLFAATTPSWKTLSNSDIAARAAGYEMPGVIADGNDVMDVYIKTSVAAKRARAGKGPTLMECKTYRVEGHCMVLKDLEKDRPKNEVEYWKNKDPIAVFYKKLLEERIIEQDTRIKLEKEMEEEFNEAVEFARNSPFTKVDKFICEAKRRYDL